MTTFQEEVDLPNVVLPFGKQVLQRAHKQKVLPFFVKFSTNLSLLLTT